MMRRRSSRVLEQTMRPSPLVTTTPPQLQARAREAAGVHANCRQGCTGAAAAASTGSRGVPAAGAAGASDGACSSSQAEQHAISPRLKLVVVLLARLGWRRQRVLGVELQCGGGGAVHLLVLGLQAGHRRN